MELAVILGAVSLGYFVKSVAGMGGPLISIPIIATFVGVEHAVVAVSLANVVTNTWLIWEHRQGARGTGSILVPLLATGAVGTVLGTWLLTELDDRILSVVMAVVVVAYIVRFVTNPEFRLSLATGRRLAAPVGAVGGVLVGATGMGGPLFAAYLHSLRLKRSTFVFALTVPFQVLGPIQIAVLASLGAYTGPRLVQAALAILPVLVVAPLGILLARRIPHRAFEWAVLGLLGLTAVRLVATAVA